MKLKTTLACVAATFACLVLLIVIAAPHAVIKWLLFPWLRPEYVVLQVFVLLFTMAGGMIAVFSYWNSVLVAERRERLERFRYLKASYESFSRKNKDMITRLDYPHLFECECLPACEAVLEYVALHKETGRAYLDKETIARVESLDSFLDHFDVLYMAIQYGLIQLRDLEVFYYYHIRVLRERMTSPGCDAFAQYVSDYFKHVPKLVEIWDKTFGGQHECETGQAKGQRSNSESEVDPFNPVANTSDRNR